MAHIMIISHTFWQIFLRFFLIFCIYISLFVLKKIRRKLSKPEIYDFFPNFYWSRFFRCADFMYRICTSYHLCFHIFFRSSWSPWNFLTQWRTTFSKKKQHLQTSNKNASKLKYVNVRGFYHYQLTKVQ